MISNTTLLVNYNALTSDKINSCRMISVRKNSRIAMSDSFIAHNKLKSQYSRSIVVKDKSTFEALRCQFIANNGHNGGVACCEGNNTINWTDSTFQQNHAADYGGYSIAKIVLSHFCRPSEMQLHCFIQRYHAGNSFCQNYNVL